MKTDQTAVARESYEFWSNLLPHNPNVVYALLAMEDGETSFNYRAIGDHGEAVSAFQWHAARVEDILHRTGIDVRTASHVDQLRSAQWEMTHGWYKRVWPKLMATQDDLSQAISILIKDYEQSSNQARDIERRTAMALKWKAFFEGETKA